MTDEELIKFGRDVRKPGGKPLASVLSVLPLNNIFGKHSTVDPCNVLTDLNPVFKQINEQVF